jgi:hypothetical protein
MASEILTPAGITTQPQSARPRRHETLRQIARMTSGQLRKMAITLLVIVFLTQFLLIMAARGRNGLPAAPATASVEAAAQTLNYLFNRGHRAF